MRWAPTRLLWLLSSLALVGLFLFLAALVGFHVPGPSSQPITVTVPSGASVAEIADQLEDAGAIGDSRVFVGGVWLFGRGTGLQAGEFTIPARASPHQMMMILATGAAVSHAVTIPEGLSSAEIVALLLADDRLAGPLTEIPAEGSLLPETYHIRRGDSRDALVQRMQAAMAEALERLWQERSPTLPLTTKDEAVTLASIIERETGVVGERRLVAGVFANRLIIGMRLQSDPTVIYAITQGQQPLGRSLTRADIDATQSPYNTYRVAGLPPGPIANPGLAALEAALNPAETDYLYFVADGSGGHAFARTLAEHNRNVAAWRRLQRVGGNP